MLVVFHAIFLVLFIISTTVSLFVTVMKFLDTHNLDLEDFLDENSGKIFIISFIILLILIGLI